MPFELWIALRYLTAKRKQTLVSVFSLIAVAGVADDGTTERGTPRTLWLGLRIAPR